MDILLQIIAVLCIAGGTAAVTIGIVLTKEHRTLWRVGLFVLSAVLIAVGIVVENQSWEAKRFDTVEEMAARCIPDAQLKDVIYYEDYAVLFTENYDKSRTTYYTTQKDEKGWRAYRRDNGVRQIIEIGKGDDKSLTTFQLNSEGLDFICVDRPGWFTGIDDPEAFQHEVKDSEGNEFTRVIIKGLDMPIYYTFADADAPGYEVIVDGNSISISQICKEYGDIIYNYSTKKSEGFLSSPINNTLIIGLIFLISAILMGVIAYRKKGNKVALVAAAVILSVATFMILIQALFNQINI